MLQLPRLFRRHRHRVKNVGAALLASMLALTVLAGCAEEDPEPKFETEPAVSPSAPAAASGPEKETVKEFLERWAEAEANMQNTGKTEEYLAMSPGCEPCESFAASLEDMYAKGGYIRTESLSIDKVQRVKGSKQQYRVWTTQPPTAFRESAVDPEESNDGGSQLYLMSLGRSTKGFQVNDMAMTRE